MEDQELSLEADLLHPLATFHLEDCPTLRDVSIQDFAVLHDILCVTSGDKLHIFSTDLHLRTTITFPYHCTALTIYQSKFVAVGGLDSSTLKITNKLWTSDTGHDWQPLLPPMPTKRYNVTAVSIGSSPQYLVVAGGQYSEELPSDVVEVLVGEQWTTVDPIPKRCYASSLILHDENLYFMAGTGPGGYIITCKCNSLISSCGDAENNSPTSGALWSEFEAPTYLAILVSFGQRLISIDVHSTITAYSSMSRSWVEVYSKGSSLAYGNVGVVLSTREFMVVGLNFGAYRVKLSVSTFDPDSKFFPGVLLRLEAAMGIQIVSAIANVYSKVATKSGVQLEGVELPDPQEEPSKYVMEVISMWSAGHNRTWRELLDVLRDVELQDLSQQIEAYMKGKEKYVDAYLHYLNSQETLELFFLKLIFLGLPRLGKTTARRRLTGEIADLMTAGEAEQPHPSTGTVESGPSMIVSLSDTTAVINESKWAGMENLKEEACMLFRIMDDIINRKKVSLSAAPRSSGDPVQTVDESTASQSTDIPHQRGSMPEQESRPVADFPSPVTTSQPRNIPQFATFFKEAMVSEYWEDVKHMFKDKFKDKFKAYLRMEDTGGQPELMDMLPALTVGPGLYLLFLNLEQELQSQYKVSYCSKEGENSIPVESTYTVKEMFLSTLSSIACSNTSTTSGISSEEVTSPEMSKILESSKSVAFVLGTHKDKVCERRIKQFDDELQEIIRPTDFFKKGTVRFWSENKLVVAMDNMAGGTEEIDEIRKLLEEGMRKHFKKLKIPVVWLLFSLCLRITAEQNKQRTADLEYCLSLASDFSMSPRETKTALSFLHHHAGVMMYFPKVPELKDLVILDNQIVYDSITIVILRALKFEGVGQAAAETFKDTGQFLLDDLTKATAEVSGDHIPLFKLVALLDFLHIIARIFPTPATQPPSMTSGSQPPSVTSAPQPPSVTSAPQPPSMTSASQPPSVTSAPQPLSVTSASQHPSVTSAAKDNNVYIMPCVLNSASTEELDSYCKDATADLSVVPIMVRYKCGFVPMGVFPAFIACLITNKSFDLIQTGIRKNKVQFLYGEDRSLVTFMSQPKYYEIHIKRETEAETPLEEECIAIREELESTFEMVSSRMNYGGFMEYQFSFKCTDHTESTSKHLGVVKREEPSPRYMDCLSDHKRPKPVKLQNCHRVWYGKQLTNTQVTQVSSSYPPSGSAPPPSTSPSLCPSPPNPSANLITPTSYQVGDSRVVEGLEGANNSPNGSVGGPPVSPPISSGPSPLNPPVNRTTPTPVTVRLDVPAIYDPVTNVVRYRTARSSQDQVSIVHGRTSAELVAKNSIGSESSLPSIFRTIPKTCNGWKFFFAMVLVAATVTGALLSFLVGVVFSILGRSRNSDSFITYGTNSLVTGVSFIVGFIFAMVVVIYLWTRKKRS